MESHRSKGGQRVRSRDESCETNLGVGRESGQIVPLCVLNDKFLELGRSNVTVSEVEGQDACYMG